MDSKPKTFTVSGVTARLFSLIEQMSESEQLTLLARLGCARQHVRKPYIMPVKYETLQGSLTDFMLDISVGGVFIETKAPVSVGEEIALSFSFEHLAQPLQIRGIVIRQTATGVGVRFENLTPEQEEALKTFIDKI